MKCQHLHGKQCRSHVCVCYDIENVKEQHQGEAETQSLQRERRHPWIISDVDVCVCVFSFAMEYNTFLINWGWWIVISTFMDSIEAHVSQSTSTLLQWSFVAEISLRSPQKLFNFIINKYILGSKYPKQKKKKKKWYCSACTAHGDPALTNRCSADDTLPARCRWLCFTTSSEATSQYQREADWWSIDKATRHHLLLSVVGLCLCVCVQQREC